MAFKKENVADGDPVYLNTNDRKTQDNHPDFIGKLMISHEELVALLDIHERATESNARPVLQVDLSAWKGKSRKDDKPYLFIKHEVYTGPRKSQSQEQSYAPAQEDDDWI